MLFKRKQRHRSGGGVVEIMKRKEKKNPKTSAFV